MQLIIRYFDYLRQLKNTNRHSRLAVEIGLILTIKVILLWLIWLMSFSHSIPKDARQQAVNRIILNQAHQ